MRIIVSLPDDTVDRMASAARDLNITRSELFTAAVLRYLDKVDEVALTDQVNTALEVIGTSNSTDAFAIRAGLRSIARDASW